jgi:hypothetical protein
MYERVYEHLRVDLQALRSRMLERRANQRAGDATAFERRIDLGVNDRHHSRSQPVFEAPVRAIEACLEAPLLGAMLDRRFHGASVLPGARVAPREPSGKRGAEGRCPEATVETRRDSVTAPLRARRFPGLSTVICRAIRNWVAVAVHFPVSTGFADATLAPLR